MIITYLEYSLGFAFDIVAIFLINVFSILLYAMCRLMTQIDGMHTGLQECLPCIVFVVHDSWQLIWDLFAYLIREIFSFAK